MKHETHMHLLPELQPRKGTTSANLLNDFGLHWAISLAFSKNNPVFQNTQKEKQAPFLKIWALFKLLN